MRYAAALSTLTAMLLAAGFVAAQAQRNEGPLLRPKKPAVAAKPAPSATGAATLLVTCDLACYWSVDGGEPERLESQGAAKIRVQPGQHSVSATTVDGLDRARNSVELKSSGQSVASFDLLPARRTREERLQTPAALKAAQEGRQGAELARAERYAEAIKLLENACAGGDALGCFEMGNLYHHGRGVPLNDEKTLENWRKGCELGAIAEACFQAGLYTANGFGAESNQAQSNAFMRIACEGGHAEGCNCLGDDYVRGLGVAKNLKRGFELMTKACRLGSGGACTQLGYYFLKGKGVAKDETEAFHSFKRACTDLNADEGCDYLGQMFAEGRVVRRNDEQAASFYAKGCEGEGAAHPGYFGACKNLVVLCRQGRCATESKAKAKALVEQICEGWNKRECQELKNLQ